MATDTMCAYVRPWDYFDSCFCGDQDQAGTVIARMSDAASRPSFRLDTDGGAVVVIVVDLMSTRLCQNTRRWPRLESRYSSLEA